MAKYVHKAGKRKMAVARATIKKGKGRVLINSKPLEAHQPEIARLKIEESLLGVSDYVDLSKIDVKVSVRGGGIMGQADAIASSIARGLVKWKGGDEILNAYLSYNRILIAGDHRQTEPHKPSQSSKGPRHKRQKSYR